ncbi:TonB-dependent receptor [Chryseolinea sp. T2]|uniref:SusC/RagA family TonB-linked outer membrane protein n=1 Tax=Chryseolinea sp. T2 TaxID=3129255 RepID=UPI00307768F9
MKPFLRNASPPLPLSQRRLALFTLNALFALGVLLASPAFAQSTISGKVTSSEDNAPLPGVSILIKGSQTGTTTDVDGSFNLQAIPSDVLVFSFIGYATQELPVNQQTTFNITMATDLQQLSEVVVVGYGTVKKTDLTGAVGLVDNKQLTQRGAVNVMDAMQGQVAGVDVSNSTGRAGSGFNIQIRGVQSFKGGQPLYVVDGVIMPEGISFLNPQDIERIDILKDASSAAIYGSRGAYGVVLVTTKGGASVKDQAVISYDGYVGVRQAARLPKFMDGDTWWNWRQDSFISDALVRNQAIPANPGYNSTGPELQRRLDEQDYTDWPSLMIQDGFQSNHWLSFSGRGDKMAYTFGAGYQDEKGNIANEEYKRYNFKASIDHTLNKYWSAGANLSLSFEDQNYGSPSAMLEAFRMNPIMSPYDVETGQLIVSPGKDEIADQPGKYHIDFTSSVNPLIDQQKTLQEGHATYAIGNVYLQYSPISWLKFKTTISPRYTSRSRGQFLGRDSEGRVGGLPYAQRQLNESYSYIWDNQITATKAFNNHNFDFIGLFSSNYFVNEMTFVAQDNMDPSAKGYYSIGATGDKTKVTSNSDYSKETLLSFAARLNYAFKDKYLVTLTSRWDGASVLAEGNKWASFPSAAIGWKLSEESFLANSSVVDNLKLRASYGFTGNKVIDPYMTMATASTPTFYDYGGTLASGIRPDLIANKNLTWERTSEVNLGLDYSFFKGRVGGTIDVYNKVSKDLIVSRQLPMESGWQTVYQNIGEVVNKGVEVSLTTVNVSNSNLEWSTTFNFAKNNNEVTKVYEGTDIIYVVLNNGAGDGYNADDVIMKGHPLGSYYNWKADGVWQAGETAAATYGQLEGQGRVVDYDGNGVINQDDKRIIGSVLPKWTGGFNSTLTYKGFDFSFSVIARQGMTAYSPFHAEFTNHEDRGRSKLDIDWYMQSNPVTQARVSNEYPQPKNAGIYWRTYSVGYYRDASFVKVKNITLGYTFTQPFVDKVGLKNLRLYGNVTNPFVFTDYDGFDPEWATASYANGGMSFTTYQLGVNAKF